MAVKKETETKPKAPRKVVRKRPARRGRPTLRLTVNGQVVATFIGPPGANDLHIMFDLPVLDGGAFFTRNGSEIGKRLIFGPGVNDFHFSPSGRFRKGGVPLKPPPQTNDIEIDWDGDFITEAWWTYNGKRVDKIPIEPGATEISVAW